MLGLFDSGSGGLSVLKALKERAPRADVVYFGDIANAPYGLRSAEKLNALTREGVAVLKRMGATHIVSACNSVSPSILAGAAGDMPVIEMTRPTAKGMQRFAGKKVLLIATPATVASRIYQTALAGVVELTALPIAELAGAIEFDAAEEEIARIVKGSFDAVTAKNFDVMLMGCTHYPLARKIIEWEAARSLGEIACIDPSAFVAEEVARAFPTDGAGSLTCKISRDSDAFRRRVEAFFNPRYSIEVGV